MENVKKIWLYIIFVCSSAGHRFFKSLLNVSETNAQICSEYSSIWKRSHVEPAPDFL